MDHCDFLSFSAEDDRFIILVTIHCTIAITLLLTAVISTIAQALSITRNLTCCALTVAAYFAGFAAFIMSISDCDKCLLAKFGNFYCMSPA